MRDKFKKFGGERIPDIIEYLKNWISQNPDVTISVGCDSVQKINNTMFGCAIMLYNSDIKNGAHVVFFRETYPKIRDNHERLYKESQMAYELAQFLDEELSKFYKRGDLDDFSRKMYKFHLMKCSGEYDQINPQDLKAYVDKISLSESDRSIDYHLVDIHLDFNPSDHTPHPRGRTNNKSNSAYRAYVPWLRGMNWRTWAKPMSFAASCAADLILCD